MSREDGQSFDRLLETFYQAWFAFHPEQAVDVGVPGYADRLSPYGDDEIGALIALLEKLLSALDEYEPSALDEDRRLDLRILQGSARLELHDLLERDWRKRNPVRFIPVHAIYQLTNRRVEDFASALRTRLAEIPGYLRGARLHLSEQPEEIPLPWLEAAVQEARGGAEFLRSLHKYPGVTHDDMHHALEAAAAALQEFAAFLEQELAAKAQSSFACGRTHYERLLQDRHFLELDADVLYVFGQSLYDQTLRDLKQVTRELRGDEDIAAATAAINAQHPSAKELLACYQRQMRSARRFLERHHLVSLPEKERLSVVETPVFLRHQIPFAAYHEPAPNDAGQQGFFYVTPCTDEQQLGEHSYAGLMHTCVHEAWPGHHLQFVTAHTLAHTRTLPRLLNPSATLYEGWALYCEQLMQEQGFLDKPEQRFILLRDRLWRALRIMIDVEIHTRGVSFDEAVNKMQRLLGFPASQARADITWYSMAPAVPMGYAVGWALINALRDQCALHTAELDLKEFHDSLLASGSIALPLVIQQQFGPELWKVVAAIVFGQSRFEAWTPHAQPVQ